MPYLYSEATGQIDCGQQSTITFNHGMGEIPDDVGISCTDSGALDQAVFNLISKGQTKVVWESSGTRSSISFRCWARRNHSIIDLRPPSAEVSVKYSGSPASNSMMGQMSSEFFLDFGTRSVTISG